VRSQAEKLTALSPFAYSGFEKFLSENSENKNGKQIKEFAFQKIDLG